MEDEDDIFSDLKEKILLGHDLLRKLSDSQFRKVQGIAKIEKKVRQELKFLEKFQDPQNFHSLKKEHISCSNLVHLNCLVEQLYQANETVSVMNPFNLSKSSGSKKVMVDIVSDGGATWIKVVARNPRALNKNCQGGNQFGQRNIVDQVRDLIHCSVENCHLFKPPAVKIVFSAGVSSNLQSRLLKLGAVVDGELVNFSDDEEEDDDSDSCDSDSDEENLEYTEDAGIDESRVNLDITAMIAYVSAMTNGRNGFRFKEKILTEQAEWERLRPVKPMLDQIFMNKELVCCESAMKDFKTIIDTLGGESERCRAEDLMRRVHVVEDQTSDKTEKLRSSGKIKSRSLTIFSTGDNLRIMTVTANTGFLRAAAGQGVSFSTITHESRALTEDKEKTATIIQK